MQLSVRKWGNSAAVRIPAAIMDAADLRLDQHVDIRAENGQVIIAPVRPVAPALRTLLAGITDENMHGPVDTGPRVGREFW